MEKKFKVLIPALVILMAAGAYFLLTGKQADPNLIKVSGNIETTTVGVGFKVAGHVLERPVDEGDRVKKGQPIANLETADLQLDVAKAKAQMLASEAALTGLKNGSRRQDVFAAEAALNSALADMQNAEEDYRRSEELFAQGAISAQSRDKIQTAYKTTSARAEQAKQQLSLVIEGPRQEEIALAAAQVEQNRQALNLAQTRLSYAQVTSPIDGVVLSKNIEPGEYVAPGTPVVTIGELDKVWLKAYIAETDLGKIQLGQKVSVKTDTYPDKSYSGSIGYIASEAEFTPKNIQTAEERVKLVYRIKIMIANTARELKPGMPADAVIALGRNE